MQISLQRVAIKSAQQEKERGREGEQLQHKVELESDTQTQVDKKLICIKKRDKKREWVVKVKGVEPRGKLTPWTLTRRRLISIKLKKNTANSDAASQSDCLPGSWQPSSTNCAKLSH